MAHAVLGVLCAFVLVLALALVLVVIASAPQTKPAAAPIEEHLQCSGFTLTRMPTGSLRIVISAEDAE